MIKGYMSVRDVGLAIALVAVMVLGTGCSGMLAGRLVKGPNYGKSVEELGDYSQSELVKWQIDRQFRIEVNSPVVSLHIGIIEPKHEWIISSGNYWYDWIRDYAKNTDKIKIPELMYWIKKPEDEGNWNGIGFSEKPQSEEVLWQEPKGNIICLHGLGMDKNILAVTWGQVLATHGYRVILADLRGHGKSTGDYITYGEVEARDVSQIIDYLENEKLLNGKVVIMGGSYGAVAAIETAAINRRVDGVIAMEAFASLKEATVDFAKERFGLLAMLMGEKGIYKTVDKAGKIAKFNPDDTPLDAVREIEVPILFIHGDEDKHIPLRHSQELNDAACCGKLVIVKGKNHLNLGFEDIYPMRDEITGWLEETDFSQD